jgi:hypothetical protein
MRSTMASPHRPGYYTRRIYQLGIQLVGAQPADALLQVIVDGRWDERGRNKVGVRNDRSQGWMT